MSDSEPSTSSADDVWRKNLESLSDDHWVKRPFIEGGAYYKLIYCDSNYKFTFKCALCKSYKTITADFSSSTNLKTHISVSAFALYILQLANVCHQRHYFSQTSAVDTQVHHQSVLLQFTSPISVQVVHCHSRPFLHVLQISLMMSNFKADDKCIKNYNAKLVSEEKKRDQTFVVVQ